MSENHLQQLKDMSALERIAWAYEIYGGGLVITSSFGMQSVVLLSLARKQGLKIPVLTVDIPGEKYDVQRQYRRILQKHFGFDLRVFEAANDSDKVSTMDRGLKKICATACLTGIRWEQTETRAKKIFFEICSTGIINIHPILDWSDDAVNDFISDPALSTVYGGPEVCDRDWSELKWNHCLL